MIVYLQFIHGNSTLPLCHWLAQQGLSVSAGVKTILAFEEGPVSYTQDRYRHFNHHHH